MTALIVTGRNELGYFLDANSPSSNIIMHADPTVGYKAHKKIFLDLTQPVNFTQYLTADECNKIEYLIWVVSEFFQKPLVQMKDTELEELTQLHFLNLIRCITWLQRHNNRFHFVLVSSCSSWRLRTNESVYCALAAAKATFARNYANETKQRVTLFNPGGMRVPSLHEIEAGTISDKEKMLDSNYLAKYIWEKILMQTSRFEEYQVLRNKVDPSQPPIIEYGPKLPEVIN